jgi:hypothetical protein
MLEGLFGIAWHSKETPGLRAGLQVVGRDVAARVVLRAAVADHHHVACHLWRAGHRVAALLVIDGVGLPQHLAVGGIERIEDAVEGGNVHLALPHRDATIHHVAAGAAIDLAVDLRFEAPQLGTGRGIERIHAPGDAGGVHHAIEHHGRGFHAARGAGGKLPRQTQARDVLAVDQVQRRVMRLAEIAARGEPGTWLRIDRQQAGAIELARRHHGSRLTRALAGGQCTQHGNGRDSGQIWLRHRH